MHALMDQAVRHDNHPGDWFGPSQVSVLMRYGFTQYTPTILADIDPISSILRFVESLERCLSNDANFCWDHNLAFSPLDHGLCNPHGIGPKLATSKHWWYHFKGLFLSFQKLIILLKLDQWNFYGS